MSRFSWTAVPVTMLVALPAAYGAQYLSADQAQQQMFPAGTRFEVLPLEFTPDQAKRINTAATVNSNFEPRAWSASADGKTIGYFFTHDVIGKQDYITYAVALDDRGKVKGVEVLAYRESHGFEIRNARWRAQFAGKSSQDAVKLDADIANISGATLSCRHMTDGIRRILAIYDAVLKAKP